MKYSTDKDLMKFLRNFSLISQGIFPPLGAYLGGIVSQEVIKAVTGKYIPV